MNRKELCVDFEQKNLALNILNSSPTPGLTRLFKVLLSNGIARTTMENVLKCFR